MTGQSQFAGVWCPSITPMDNDSKIDLNGPQPASRKRLTEAKIDVILLMGNIGEFASFAARKAIADPRGPRHELAEDGRQRLIHLPE